jgi:hypothetical protein
MKLIGHVFNTGRIDFTRVDNPWAFRRIDAGMKQSQADRIRVDPAQAPIELRSAPVNGDDVPDWLPHMQRVLKTADAMYLQFKSGVLRFRLASHDAGKNRTFVTLGNQDEFNLYATQNWRNLRYMYAARGIGPSSFSFYVQTLITHRQGLPAKDKSIELQSRMHCHEDLNKPRLIVDATGSNASVDIIEWRGKVKEGETGRYAVDEHRLEFSVREVQRPFTLLHENRVEFKSDSYTFSDEKIGKLLDRVIEKRLKEIDSPAVVADEDDDFEMFED